MGTLREEVSILLTISRWILLRMKNFLPKSRRENRNTQFKFNNFFSKIAPFMIYCRKTWRPRNHKWSHKMAHTYSMLDCQDYMHICACTRPRARIHICTHAHACTYRPISNTYCFSTATMLRERSSLLRYTYIACFVFTISAHGSGFIGLSLIHVICDKPL
jgi:hypothetical protein